MIVAFTDESLALLDHIADGIAVTRRDGALTYCSRPLEELLGGDPAFGCSRTLFAELESVGHEKLSLLHERAFSTGVVQRTRVAGRSRPLEARVVLRPARFRDAPCVVWSFEDTRGEQPERLIAMHAALQDQQVRLKLAGHRTDFGFWDVDLENDALTWWNDWCMQTAIDPCTGTNHCARWDAFVHPDDLPLTQGYHDVVAGRSQIYEAEFRVRTQTGEWLWISSRGMATVHDALGRPRRITGVTIDIDARKRAELALRESEARLEAAVWGTELGLWEIRADGTCWWFDDWCESRNIEPHHGRRQRTWLELVHPQDAGLYQRLMEESMSGITDHYVAEFRVRARDGAWRWVHERGRVTERDATGAYRVMVGVCIDIDSRKQMEAALFEAQQRYEIAVNAAHLPVWELHLVGGRMRVNAHFHSALGYAADDPVPFDEPFAWRQMVHPDDLPAFLAMLETNPSEDGGFFEQELRAITRAGTHKWFLIRGRVVEEDDGAAPVKIVGIAVDIDARKRAELAVRDSELRLAMILDTMREGVVLVDAAARIEFTNPAFDMMVGHRGGELKGVPVLDLFAFGKPVKPQTVARWFSRFNARSGSRSLRFARPDGSEFTGEILTGTFEVSGQKKTLYVVQDVSERKQLEKEITESTHRERRRLGIDLHDGLGQELTGISLLLRSLAARLDSTAAEIGPDLDLIIGHVNHAIQTTRTMAMGMSPVTLERGGLVMALGTLAAWSRTTLGCDVRLRRSRRVDFRLDDATATHLYLIAQEAILNAVKHGKARSIRVSLNTSRNMVSLAIADDGMGFERDPRRRPSAGMGLKIMAYRAGVMGGSLRIKNRRGGGTRVHCICPHGRARSSLAPQGRRE